MSPYKIFARNDRFLPLVVVLLAWEPVAAQKQFGFDNQKPTGQPYLTPEETVRQMTVPDGFAVSLFAGEPLVVNPIAFTVDERGRLWVVECFEYPSRTPADRMPRDRIVILEDTTGDGRADKRTVFAEGKDFPVRFDLASGIEVGRGGVFLGSPPYLWFIENHNDQPGRFEILLRGFGSQDTHETLNTFHWGPDGWLHGLHGVFTHSEVNGVKLNAAVWRFQPDSKKFEIVAEGTSNPWGIDYRETDGEQILACCVIPHLFHVFPGGIYKRQAGSSFNTHAYGYLNEICDHTFHKESGWAHAGLISLDTPVVPKEYHQSVIFGSIHGSSLKRNDLSRRGSTYTARKGPDFLVSGDKNVRPLNLRWGPGGEIYCIDWHDQNPCHQADPGSWDQERGRIYRIAHRHCPPHRPGDLAAWSDAELAALATGSWRSDPALTARTAVRAVDDTGLSPWWGRTARRILADRRERVSSEVRKSLRSHADPALLAAVGDWDEAAFARSPRSVAAIRATGDLASVGPESLKILAEIARDDDPFLRREVAAVVRRWPDLDARPILHNLLERSDDAADPALPLMIWYAYEPRLAAHPAEELDWLLARAGDNRLIREQILPRAARRLGSTDEHRDRVLAAAGVARGEVRRQVVSGLAVALANRRVAASPVWLGVRAGLLSDPNAETRRLAERLAVSLSDADAVRRAVAVAADDKQPIAARVEAVRALGLAGDPEAVAPLIGLVTGSHDVKLRAAACRALAAFDSPAIADLVGHWADCPAELRGDLVDLLAGRKPWAEKLLAAVGAGQIDRAALTPPLLDRIQAFRDAELTARIEKVWGKVRPTPDELVKLIDELRDDLDRHPGSFGRGRAVFDQHCAKCHQFDGRGHGVGPPLEGAGRDIEYILANVLDPNRAVGAPYFLRRAVLANGRIEEGLLAAEDDRSITLKGENDAVKVISRDDIDELQVIERSVMPEGLAYSMTREDFRNLVRYLMAHPFVTEWSGRRSGVSGRVERPADARDPLEARFTTAKPLSTRLLIGASEPITVRLDGRVVYSGTPGPAPARPDQSAIELDLSAGEHTLTVEAHGGPFYLRWFDPDRLIRYPDSDEPRRE